MIHLLPALCVLALSIQTGESVKCYVCSSDKDSSCRDPFNKDHHYHKLTECSAESMRSIHETIPGLFYQSSYSGHQHDDFVCVKAVRKEYDREEVVRSCTIPRPDTFDVCSQLKSRHLTFCKTCTGDACNAADVSQGSLLLALLPATLVGLRIIARAC